MVFRLLNTLGRRNTRKTFSNPFIGLLLDRYYLEDSTGFRRQRFRPPSGRHDG